ncbi:MAG TPA: tetratricopeptide repeat protein [Bacillota bacterium]|nr:tetratricopeptide repeat protein [Bacillota bacterium]
MRFSHRINNLLEYKLTPGLPKRLGIGQALLVVILFAGIILMCTAKYAEQVRSQNTTGYFSGKIRALEAHSSPGDSRVELALAYYLQGDTAKAEQSFRQILQADPANAAASIYYGIILADGGMYAQAIPLMEKGVAADPQRENLVYLYLGQSYYYQGDLTQAEKNLAISTRVNAVSPLNHYYLGLIYARKGDIPGARTAFNTALRLAAGNFPEAARELAKLPPIE